MKTFLFPVSVFCCLEDICIMGETKNWMEKSTTNSHHDNTTLK